MNISNLNEKQLEAVQRASDISKRVVAVAGPAGTGKTTIMKFAYEALDNAGYKCVIVAPTGKAARRVREATGLAAKTIHMLLEYTAPLDIDEKTGKPFGDTHPRRDRQNPIDAEVVFADEYAMVNRELHANLVAALPPGGRLIVFGDNAQLPPIESSQKLANEPTAFKMLLDKFNGIYLEQVHRQAEDSGILSNAQRVLRRLPPQANDDFTIHMTDQPLSALMEVIDKHDYTSLRNQIIVPGNRGFVGTHALNVWMQERIGPDSDKFLQLSRHRWEAKQPITLHVGDKVIMCKNWYDLEANDGTRGVFNGEVGIVQDITELEEVIIDFEDRVVAIPPITQIVFKNAIVAGYPQRDLQLAYVVTTHKAQGSEFDAITYVINKAHLMLLNRRNLYTALTRAKYHATMIADVKGLSMSIFTAEPKVFGQ